MADNELPSTTEKSLRDAIAATKEEEYLIAFNIFSELYRDGYVSGTAEGLSYYGVTLALLNKKTKEALELCNKALKMQPFEPAHYVNTARIYVANNNRKKAVAILEQGLKRLPRNKIIVQFWRTIGIRAKPPIPFLSRDNFLNVLIGRKRYEKKQRELAEKKKKRG